MRIGKYHVHRCLVLLFALCASSCGEECTCATKEDRTIISKIEKAQIRAGRALVKGNTAAAEVWSSKAQASAEFLQLMQLPLIEELRPSTTPQGGRFLRPRMPSLTRPAR